MNEKEMMQRMEKLETSNRRMKRGMIACGVSVVALLLLGAERVSAPISATGFKLVDNEGRLRAELGSDKEGTFFFLNDETGKLRASMAAQAGAAFISFKDPQGKSRAGLTFDENGAAVRLKDETGMTRAMLLHDDRGPVVQLRDEAGRVRTIEPLADVLAEPKAAGSTAPPKGQ